MILEICKKYGIMNFEINKDGSIDVKDDVHIEGLYLTEMPLRFNKVYGNFYCDSNNITSLKGSPNWVSGNFECSNNNIKSLEHSPKNVGDNFYCEENYIYNLDKFDCVFKGIFNCLNNPIGTLFNEVSYDFIQAFKSLKVVKDKELNIRRFKYLMFNIFDKKYDYEKIDFSEVEKYYTIK